MTRDPEPKDVVTAEDQPMRRLKRALAAVLVVLMIMGPFPSRLGARGPDVRAEFKRLHFHLDQDGFLDPDEEHHLHVAGRHQALQRHTHATLESFRAESPGAPSEPSHYADLLLPNDRVAMLYVTQRSDHGGSVAAAHGAHVDHGLSLPIIHIPNHARRHAIRTATVRGLVKTGAATDGGCASDLNGDGAVTDAELNSFTPCDVAKTLLYHHPQLLNFDANKGATGMTLIENAPGLDQLALFIKSQGRHRWYMMPPVLNGDGTQFTRPDTGKPVFSYVVNDNVQQAAVTALQNALIGVTNEPTLAEASYNIVDGTTAVVQGGSSPLSNLAPQPGVFKLLAGGLGLGGTRKAMVEEMEVALTLLFELGIPSFLLLSTAASSDLAESLRNIYTSTAFVRALEEDRMVPPDFQDLVTLLARTMAPSPVLDALPFAGWIVTAVNIASTEGGAAAVAEVGATGVTLEPSRGAGEYPVYASADLRAGNATARQAIVIVHGRLRNASDYFATGRALVDDAGAAGRDTIVVAPQLLLQADATHWKLPERYLRWDRGWEEGAPARGPSPASSYDVLDDVAAKLSNGSVFPALRRIVFVGHGGGAQMLARYAVVAKLPPGPAISFVMANPGSYLYLTADRPLAPDKECVGQDFDRWKYGLSAPPPYVDDLGRSLKEFAVRDVTLLLGSNDRKATGSLDQSCAAKVQGRNRIDRGRFFVEALARSGQAPRLRHHIVDGVGHDEAAMLRSSPARKAIFATD
jgi:hypothetical protein